MIKKIGVSEEEIQEAIKKFKAQGGLIKHLPKEVVPSSILVGRKYGRFENLLEHHLQSDFPYSF